MAKEKSTVRIKFLTSIGGEIEYRCGEVAEVDAELATQLIEAGIAVKA